MKTFFAIAVGALALVGCGPLDEGETMPGQVAQAVELMPASDPKTVPSVPRAPPTTDQEKLYNPDRQTFLNTFIYDTGYDTPFPH